MEPSLALEGISKSYGETQALQAIDLAVEPGSFVVLLGPSGSGKTTLLSILGGFTAPSSGRVFIEGRDVTALPAAKRPTATVFQDYALFPHMSVAGNVAFGLRMKGQRGAEVRRQVDEALALVGLEGFGTRRIDQLSGGQRQRVALARALVIHPAVLLLDEPLGALDLHLRRRMQEELQHLQRRIGATFVHVTHDQEEAMNLADLVVVINHGRIEDLGDPRRVYLEPATRFTATFMGESNILEGRVVSAENGVAKVETALGPVLCSGTAETGARVEVCIRPEHLSPAVDAGPALTEARVTEAVFQGTRLRCHVLTEGRNEVELIASFAPDAGIGVGDRLRLSAKPENVIVLHA